MASALRASPVGNFSSVSTVPPRSRTHDAPTMRRCRVNGNVGRPALRAVAAFMAHVMPAMGHDDDGARELADEPVGQMRSELMRTCKKLGIPYGRGKGIVFVFHDRSTQR